MQAMNDIIENSTDALGGIALFYGLTGVQLAHLGTLLRRKTLAAGTLFITAEQPGELVYVLGSGAIKVYLDDADGNEVILALLVAGEVLGEMSLIDCASRCANAVTLEETTVFWLDRAGFQQCLRALPLLQENLLRLLCRRLRLANERIQSLAVQDVEGRVARQLLSFAELYGQPAADSGLTIPFRLTQSDLASLVGATRGRVNQVIAAYKQRQYLSVDQHYRITIHNPAALSNRARYASRHSARDIQQQWAEPLALISGVPDLTVAVAPNG